MQHFNVRLEYFLAALKFRKYLIINILKSNNFYNFKNYPFKVALKLK